MTGLIDVGGGMRGAYGAGVLDTCLDNGVRFDLCIGVSAGAANIASYMAGQRGRNLVFYTEYAFRREYMSWRNFFRTGSYIDLDYIYGTLSVSGGEYPLDFAAVAASGIDYRIVMTNAVTGEPVYAGPESMKQDDYAPVKGSCCVPVIDKPYMIGGVPYFDGGLSDPIPYKKALALGCDRIAVILTRPRDYYRSPDGDRKMAKLLGKYPASAEGLRRRAETYNRQLDGVKRLETEGRAIIAAPKDIDGMSTLTKNREAIERLYSYGVEDGNAVVKFMKG